MLDLKLLLDHPERVKRALELRGESANFSPLMELAEKRRELRYRADELKAERNRKSKQIGELMREGHKEQAEALKAEVGALPEQIKKLDAEIAELEQQISSQLLRLPNIPDESVPVGQDESQNQEVRRWGQPKKFDFPVKDHVELGEKLGILDFERAAKITGARFALLKGAGSRLERALINFFLDLHTREHGYIEVLPPFMANKETLTGSGNLPKFEADLFKVTPFDYYMVPTAEVPLTSMYRDEIIPESELPIRFCAYTPCFRSEAGSYGKDVRGLIRQHQFDKVELYVFCHPERSFAELERLTDNAEEVLRRLGLPYRVMALCTGDMGFNAAKTYDIEVWLPSQNCYREISSCSNCTDFQARRANIRFKPEGRKKGTELVHTLNGSGLAAGRTWLAILENYQQRDGSVVVPEALRPYMGMEVIR